MLKPVVSAYIVWLILVLCLPTHADVLLGKVEPVHFNEEYSTTDISPLTELGSDYHNNIPLLQNRFRVDYKVEQVTMIFFREYGSAPIVLVQPDGSKLFASDADDDNLFWFDTATYDMISIKNPTPGPWQAVGQVKPESRIMVISDLALHAEPLPDVVFSGEILKQTAYLTNDGVPIDYAAFRDVVELTINFSSTNNPNFNNFGSKIETVAIFEDNGKGMDEIPLDGTFTGQFNLAIADGEWLPIYNVSTPMFSRQQIDPPISLFANPIIVDVEMDGGGSGYHKVTVDAAREYVDMSTLLLDGKVRFPNGDIQNFSITDMSSDIREYLVVNYEYGVYRVKLTAYGNTVDGREFILDVPEFTFLSEEPEPEVIPEPEATTELKLATPTETIPPAEEKMSTFTLVSLIIGINLFILSFGAGLIWWLISDKKTNVDFTSHQKTSPESDSLTGETQDLAAEKKRGLFAKLFTPKVKVASQEIKQPDKKPRVESDGGFKDLSIPKE